MTSDPRDPAVRRQRLKSSLAFVGLATVSTVLLLVVLSLAVWRAFTSEEIPPTPTIPAFVEPNYAYVSALEGQAVSVPGDDEATRTLAQGDTVEAGPEALIRVPDEGWLRLGFVNGATVYLGEGSEIVLEQIAEIGDGRRDTVIHINAGQLLAAGGNPSLAILVRAASGAEARGSGQALFGVTYEQTAELLELHCFEGACLLAGPTAESRPVSPGTYRWVLEDREISAAGPVRVRPFQSLGDPGILAPLLTDAPTNTSVSTTAPAAEPTLAASATPSPAPTTTPTPSPTPAPVLLGAAPGVPPELVAAARALATAQPGDFAWSDAPASATVTLAVGEGEPLATWVYAAAAPFPTITDAVSLVALRDAWQGAGPWPLLLPEPVAQTFTRVWGAPAADVQVVSATDLVDRLWAEQPARTILPFPRLEPRLKVLALGAGSESRSPLAPAFDPAGYPLALTVGATGPAAEVGRLLAAWDGPTTNRRNDQLTQVALTGPSGLGRTVADRMAQYGPTYPGEEVAPVLRAADIAHLSNEVPFAPDCPPSQPPETTRFCAPPAYFELIEYVGVDVNEMTGNHVNDWGEPNLHFTLDLYHDAGVATFGGGRDLEAAREPLRLEHNGNRIAFVGCNPVGPPGAWARSDYAGARPCEYGFPELREQIWALKQEGYLVIATLQYLQNYTYAPVGRQVGDFHALAAAGADVVSGSQGHQPQGFGFVDGAFIHYGLGNLFFDQMGSLATRQSFIDRHTIYEGRLLSVELWTGLIEDFSRPRPMTGAERANLLQAVFRGSDWNQPAP